MTEFYIFYFIAVPIACAVAFAEISRSAVRASKPTNKRAERILVVWGYACAVWLYGLVTAIVLDVWSSRSIPVEFLSVLYFVLMPAVPCVGTIFVLRLTIGDTRPGVYTLPLSVLILFAVVFGMPPSIGAEVAVLGAPILLILWHGVYSHYIHAWAKRVCAHKDGIACASCGYDLRALPTTTCPECGAVPHAPTTL